MRSPELDLVVQKHESPLVRLPKKLPSRPESDQVRKVPLELRDTLHWNRASIRQPQQSDPTGEGVDEDEEDGVEKTWDRTYLKNSADKFVRNKLKKAATDKKEATAAAGGGAAAK